MITTAGKTLPEVANEVLGKLVEQGKRCINDEGSCLYGEGQTHCAIGWLLPEDNAELMEFTGGVHRLVGKDLGPNQKFIESNREALGELQTVHDATYPKALSIAAAHLKESVGPIPNLDEWCALRTEQMKGNNNAI